MTRFIGGLICGVLLVPIALYLYFLSGRAPVATSDPMLPFEELFARTALHARLDREMPRSVPIQAEDAAFAAGASVYKQDCSACHGLINQPEAAIPKGMFPHPPQLLKPGEMVTDDPPGETYWKVKNGIRLSGMPGFHASLSDDQMWQVSLMLANADKLPEPVKQELNLTVPEPPASSAQKEGVGLVKRPHRR